MCQNRKHSSKNKNNSYNTECYIDDSNSDLSPRGHIQVTPQMIRAAVKRLQFRKLYVSTNLINEYLRRNYPVNSNIKEFREELVKKLNCAVFVGLIVMHSEDAYCLPNIREEANNIETAFTAFWETYKNYKKLHISQNRKQNKKRSNSKRTLRNMFDYLEDYIIKETHT